MAERVKRSAAEVAALKAEARTNTARAAEVKRDAKPAPKPEPRPAPTPHTVGVGTIHQDITGEKENAPLMGDVIGPLSDYVDEITFRHQSRPIGRMYRAELHVSMTPDCNWGIETGPMPPDRYGYNRRPPVVQPMMERPATPEEMRSAINNTRMTVTVLLPGPPPPRYPKYLRVLFWPLTRASHFEGTATVELRHVVRPEDVPSFPDRVRVPGGTSLETS
jgi:hypothetical protein